MSNYITIIYLRIQETKYMQKLINGVRNNNDMGRNEYILEFIEINHGATCPAWASVTVAAPSRPTVILMVDCFPLPDVR